MKKIQTNNLSKIFPTFPVLYFTKLENVNIHCSFESSIPIPFPIACKTKKIYI